MNARYFYHRSRATHRANARLDDRLTDGIHRSPGAAAAAKTSTPAPMVQRSVATRGHSVKLPEGITAEKLGRDVFNKTYYPKGEDADASRKPWVVIDAGSSARLGRLSTVAATHLCWAGTRGATPRRSTWAST